jgi:hypothetical protein
MLAAVLAMQDFLWAALAVAVLLTLGLVLGTGNVDWKKRRMKVLGLLFGLRSVDALWISSAVIRVVFVISVVLFHIEMSLPFLVFYAAVFLLGLLTLRRSPSKYIVEIVSGVVTGAALVVTNIMWSFLMEVRSDTAILIVYILLSVFMALYTLYVSVKDLGDLFERRI